MSYLRKLNKAYAQLSKAKNFDDLLRRSVKAIQGTLGFDRAGILLFDSDTNEQVGTWGIDATGKLRKEHGLRYPITEDLITLQSKEVIRLVRNKSLNDLGEVSGIGWHVQAVIFSGNDLFGWLFVDNLVNGKDITKEEYEVLETFSTVLGQLIIRTKIEDTLLEALDSLATHESRTSDALSQIKQLKAQIDGSQNMVKLGEKLSGLVPMSTRYIGNLSNFISLLSPSQFDASNLDLLDSAKTSANKLSRIFKFVDARVHEATDNDQQQLAISVVEDYWRTQFLPMFRNTPHELTIQSTQPDQVINIPLILLTQLVKELLANALAHGLETTPKGFTYVSIHSDDAKLTIDIEDSGSGLEESQLNEVIKLFVTSKPNENLGTGLNVVQHYVERWLNGQLELSQSEHGGLKASLIVPIEAIKPQ